MLPIASQVFFFCASYPV